MLFYFSCPLLSWKPEKHVWETEAKLRRWRGNQLQNMFRSGESPGVKLNRCPSKMHLTLEGFWMPPFLQLVMSACLPLALVRSLSSPTNYEQRTHYPKIPFAILNSTISKGVSYAFTDLTTVTHCRRHSLLDNKFIFLFLFWDWLIWYSRTYSLINVECGCQAHKNNTH